jgi:hypothetical protein
MPLKSTIKRAASDRRAGKSASTQAGEFVREEIHRVRAGKHGVRSAKQAIAIGLSEARRAGVKVPVPKKGSVPEETRQKAMRDSAAGRAHKKPSRTRARATLKALKRESSAGASHTALSRQARATAKRGSAAQRSASAKKAAHTKGAAGRSAAARKAARTRARRKTSSR